MSIQDMSLNDMYLMRDNKINHQNAKTQIEKDVYHLNNQNIRSAYGLSDTDDVPLAVLNQYIAAAEEVKGRNDTKKALLTKVTNTETNPNIQKSADAIKNFNYNPSKDAAYQAYVDAYNRQGQSAAKQTLNNLNSANMGRNSSYSSAATAQVQQAYAKQASEMIPTLAQQAYERLVNNYSIARDMDDTQYNRALTGYQLLADDYTRGLTDEQLRLNNIAAETELKYLEPQLQQAVAMGEISLADALIQHEANKKYTLVDRGYQSEILRNQAIQSAYGGGSGGGSSGGSSASGKVSTKNIDAFIKDFNNWAKTQNYYIDAGIEGDVISSVGGTYNWNNNIGGSRSWAGPLIRYMYSSPNLSAEDINYLSYVMGLDKDGYTTEFSYAIPY